MTAGPPARYFPVREAPLRMEAGLHRFGTDFGNGASDARFFQVDEERERYLAARAAVPPHRRDRVRVCDERDRAAHDAVRRWMRERIGLELPGVLPDPGTEDAGSFYAAVAALVQEDFVVIRRDAEDATEAAIAVFVSFPSGWRPERILGASFREIHGPVPGFADDPVQTRAMAASMIERGPYVRFVWTITADDHLDHHADEGRREPWSEASRGWLRVERQVTVPFPAPEASLFLIRTYLYAFDDLASRQRETLSRALRAMPASVARYKGLDARAMTIAIARLSGD